MDPNATWKIMAEAWENDEYETTQDSARNMLAWLKKGGFPPAITGQKLFDRAITIMACNKILLKGEFNPNRKG